MSRWFHPRGLRSRIALGFAAGALLVSAVLAGTSWVLAREFLIDQRERSSVRGAFADAGVLTSRLSTAGADVADVLGELVPSGGADVVVRSGDAWFSSTLDVGARTVPEDLQELVASGSAGTARIRTSEGPALVVGIPVDGAGIEIYELSSMSGLEGVLRTLAAVLAAGALAATLAGGAFGRWASRRAVAPLEEVAAAATRIAGGQLTTRLQTNDDPDLLAIVASFNSMVDALAARIERDNRFVGDVSHELRSPLTSLMTSVEVLARRREELPGRAQQALLLVETELSRFRRTLDDLLQLARLDGAPSGRVDRVSLTELVRELLSDRGDPPELLDPCPAEDAVLLGDKLTLERALRNLLDNADRHAGGPTAVSVQRRGEMVVVQVDDAGPGIPPEQRERVFERFARGAGAARRSLPGAGLGLAIVAETAAQYGGAAWVTDRPGGGARFVLSLAGAQP